MTMKECKKCNGDGYSYEDGRQTPTRCECQNRHCSASVDSIDWLATLDKITMEIRDDAEDAICGTRPDEGRAMLETIERVRTDMGVKQLW